MQKGYRLDYNRFIGKKIKKEELGIQDFGAKTGTSPLFGQALFLEVLYIFVHCQLIGARVRQLLELELASVSAPGVSISN